MDKEDEVYTHTHTHTHTHIYTHIYIHTVIGTHICIYTMEYYPSVEKNKIMPFAASWMDLEIDTLNEVSQRCLLYDINYM